MDFTGVDIRGTRFRQDNDVDYGSLSFINAIYDETTAYNDISFTSIYGDCKYESSSKVMKKQIY